MTHGPDNLKTPTLPEAFVRKGDTTENKEDTPDNSDCYDSRDYGESRTRMESRGVHPALRKT
jgi:hypothetical protein